MQTKNRTIAIIFALTLSAWALGACNNTPFEFSRVLEDSGPAPAPNVNPANPDEPMPNPFVPPVPTVPPGQTATDHTQSFTQSSASSMVDILWVIDNSGSMENNQEEI